MTLSAFIFALIMTHAALGGLALVTGLISAIVTKGQRFHKLFGKIFFYSGTSSIILSIVITQLPGHFNPFLLSIGLFSLYFLLMGFRSIGYKNENHNFTIDKLLTIGMAICCILMIVLPVLTLKIINIVTTIFGVLGLFITTSNLRWWADKEKVQKSGLRFHIIHMSAALISMVSAFLVVNDFLPSLLNWFLPTIIGTLFIVRALRKYVPQRVIPFSATSMVVLTLMLLCYEADSQNLTLPNEKTFTKTQMMGDYEILYSSLINYHPAPFFYTTEKELKSYFESQKASFPETLTEREFFVKAKQLIVMIKCGHISGEISSTWNTNHQDQFLYLPFSIKNFENKVYFSSTIDENFEFSIGEELLAINGVGIGSIYEQIGSTIQRDGLTFSYVNIVTELIFRTLYMRVFGQRENVMVQYRSNKGDTLSTTVNMTNKSIKPLIKIERPEELKLVMENKWSTFAIDSTNRIAYLKISSFGERKAFKKYYESVFKTLKSLGYNDLVIDLRYNGGGFFGNGNNLLRYLTPQKFEFNFQREKRPIDKNKFTKMDKWNKLTKFAFSVKPRKHKVKGVKIHTFNYKPKKNRFDGQVHVINNGYTFSQAALVAAHLREYGATFYGSETGGTESATNAMTQHELVLPQSGIKIKIPYYQAISNSTKGTHGLGVQPDYKIEQSLNREKDEILLEVVRIIKNSYTIN